MNVARFAAFFSFSASCLALILFLELVLVLVLETATRPLAARTIVSLLHVAVARTWTVKQILGCCIVCCLLVVCWLFVGYLAGLVLLLARLDARPIR